MNQRRERRRQQRAQEIQIHKDRLEHALMFQLLLNDGYQYKQGHRAYNPMKWDTTTIWLVETKYQHMRRLRKSTRGCPHSKLLLYMMESCWTMDAEPYVFQRQSDRPKNRWMAQCHIWGQEIAVLLQDLFGSLGHVINCFL